MGEWQPIETAPTDGEMLAWSALHGFSLAQCSDMLVRNGATEYFNGDVFCIATHWMPLPEPPPNAPA